MTVAYERFEPSPSRVGFLLTLVPLTVAVTVGATSTAGLLASTLGAVVVLGGVRFRSRAVVTVGTVAVFGGALVAGVQGAVPVRVVVSAGAALVAWDAGTNAIGVARQLGARAETRRLLVVHTLATTVVATVIAVATLLVYGLSRGGRPTTAVALLLLAALVFIVLLDR